jgi:3-dehydroquinate synthase
MKTLAIRHSLGEYPVLIGAGATARLVPWLQRVKLGPRLILVSHAEVLALHGQGLLDVLAGEGFEVRVITVACGEEHKSLEEAARLYQELSQSLAERRTPLLALGGGVIGDLAGFVAATYMRGLPLVHIPTTLLAQVDSSLGGKTAVNCGGLKNQVGVFYAPRAVISDIESLRTLPPHEIRNGLAEILKSAVVGEPCLFAMMERSMDRLLAAESRATEEAVYLAASVKARVVSRDEREMGLRQVLNLGHTVGHAIETVTAFQVSHGEAVAMGMVAAGRIANRLRLFSSRDLERLERLIAMSGCR